MDEALELLEFVAHRYAGRRRRQLTTAAPIDEDDRCGSKLSRRQLAYAALDVEVLPPLWDRLQLQGRLL